jgi:hypothetical protein
LKRVVRRLAVFRITDCNHGRQLRGPLDHTSMQNGQVDEVPRALRDEHGVPPLRAAENLLVAPARPDWTAMTTITALKATHARSRH